MLNFNVTRKSNHLAGRKTTCIEAMSVFKR